MRVVIAGGGSVGRFIAEQLQDAGHDVLIIDQDPAVVKRHQSAGEPRGVAWFEADACEVTQLAEAKLSEADVMAAVTGDDEDNLVISLLVKQEFGVPRVVARVNNPKNEWMFNEMWGIDVAVSTPHLLTALVEEAVSVGTFVRLLSFEGGRAKLAEVTLDEKSLAIDKEIQELQPAARLDRGGRGAGRPGDRAPRRHHGPGRRRGDRAGDGGLRGGGPSHPDRGVGAQPAQPCSAPCQQGVGRVQHDQTAALAVGHALQQHAPPVLDAADVAPPREHRGGLPGAVAHHHLQRGRAGARQP